MPTPKPFNVLYLCTHNSARSILAEAITNHLGRGRFRGFSAGSFPKSQPNPLALKTLEVLGMPTAGLRSKSWDEFALPGAPVMDFVFTVCDNAAGEACPAWPGQPATAHWGVEDPSEFVGSEAQRLRRFHDTALILKRRIELLMQLPIDKLERIALQRSLEDIGRK